MKDKMVYVIFFTKNNGDGLYGGACHSLRKAKKLKRYLSTLVNENMRIYGFNENQLKEILKDYIYEGKQ